MSAPHWLGRTRDEGLGCYVHIPFCDRICPYCDFAVVLYRDARIDRYLASLLSEVASSPQRGPLQTLYLGGGTPSALPLGALQTVLSEIFARFQTKPGTIECTLEANPARNVQDLTAWREAGVNRLSIGVQSFDDGELHRLGRDHTSAQAAAFCRAARAAGFENISLDLIAGVPSQDRSTFERTLTTALSLDLDHISVYGLTIEEGTPYAAWQRREPAAFPGDDELAIMLEQAHDIVSAAGFVH
ncbi:MAG TPA: coproporphyrinogen-III oxidase family protein, partial [Candidatus Eremiobacteraceae bacterium]|nr:coproporphyrinogen-III oxidase family protein [Candidatus Eremiobacteraceae bacterium]